MNDVSCIGHLSSANSVKNVPTVVTHPPVGARFQQFGEKWEALGSSPKVVTILREGYTLPFRFRPNLTRSPTVIRKYVNPQRQSHLLEALYQLTNKNAVEPVENQNSLGFYNWLFLVPKPNNRWKTILDLSTLNTFLNTESFKMETPETIRTSLQIGEWVTSIDFKDAYFHIPIRSPESTCVFTSRVSLTSSKPYPLICPQPLWSSQWWPKGQIDGLTEGYKNPPVPRRLVGESHIPPNLSPAYTDLGSSLSRTRVAGEQGKVRTGPKQVFNFVGYQFNLREGKIRSTPDLNRLDIVNPVRSGVPGPAVHVPYRPSNSHRKTSPPGATLYEAHTVAIEKQLEGTRVTGKGDNRSQVAPPSLKLVAGGKQCSSRSTITPSKTFCANLYRRIKRRVGHSLKLTHCKGNLVSSRKQVAHKSVGTKSGLSGLKEVPRPLFKQHSPGSHRQHNSGCLYQQRRGDEVGLPVCPTMENPVLVHQETGNSQGTSHPRPTERDSRQAIQTWPDHSNGIVPLPRSVQSYMLPVAPTTT